MASTREKGGMIRCSPASGGKPPVPGKRLAAGAAVRACCLFLLCGVSSARLAGREAFPVPKGMDMRVQFWIDVFTRYSIAQSLFHDSENPERIYRILDFSEMENGFDPQTRGRVEEEERGRISAILRTLSLALTDTAGLSPEETGILKQFGPKPRKNELLAAAERVRIQTGMKETFRDGIVRSGRYMGYIRNIFREKSLPDELSCIPHVESSFNHRARSRSGAVGIWQFTRATGKFYLQIDPVIDERKDPFASTEAAASLLKHHYTVLKEWPLAVMAYQYGLTGIKKAAEHLKTRDAGTLIRKYRHRRFGFASRNFYLEFLAAAEVCGNAERYFPGVKMEPEMRFTEMTLELPLSFDDTVVRFSSTDSLMLAYNPAFSDAVLNGEKEIPAGTRLRIPETGSLFACGDSAGNGMAGVSAARMSRCQWAEIIGRIFGLSIWPQIQNGAEDSNGALVFSTADSDLASSGAGWSGMEAGLPAPQWEDLPFWPGMKASLALEGDMLSVQPDETLGHFAEWLDIPTRTLREINRLDFTQRIRVGQKLKMRFTSVSREHFTQKRLAFHQAMRQPFVQHFQVADSFIHTVSPGETLWSVAKEKYNVPLWLLMAWNECRDPNRVHSGEQVRIPVLAPAGTDSAKAMSDGIFDGNPISGKTDRGIM